ncbi:MAG: methyltransferase domain-containing protein [Planctomycetales bacterium]|nr:methyltransferase domain-containing protein [Planctomycetales bacterium]
MLERQLEPEIMDSYEEASGYDQMDHAEVNRLFVDDLLAFGNVGSDILDLGTGTARIPIELCRRSEDCRILAVDMAASMLDLAKLNVELASLTQRIFLQQTDAKKMPYEDGEFDTTMSNSIIHHLPDPESAVREAVRVTKPGGMLFFRDLSRPASQSELDTFVEMYAGSESEHAQQMFADSLAAALTVDEFQQLIVPLGFAASSVVMTSDRHWTWAALKPT